MSYPIVHLAETSLHLSRLYVRMRLQRSSLRHCLTHMLADLHPEAAASLPASTLQRMFKYHEIAEHVICGALARMQGRRLSDAEQRRLVLLSVMGPLYDDLFNERAPEIAHIRRLSQQPASGEARSMGEALFRRAYIRLLESTPEPGRVVTHFCEVCQWQEASLKQRDPAIAEAELFRICYHKSYHSVLLFYTAFDKYPSPAETAMAFPMAGLLQLTNDVFDIWKDIRAGIYTVPILYRRYGRLERRFLSESARFNQALGRLLYPSSKRKEYAQTVHALNAMGWLAIRRLRHETKGVEDLAGLALLGRKKLVCDMNSLSRIWGWVRRVRELVNLHYSDGPTEPAMRRESRLPAAG